MAIVFQLSTTSAQSGTKPIIRLLEIHFATSFYKLRMTATALKHKAFFMLSLLKR
jgi:hypothetical protein